MQDPLYFHRVELATALLSSLKSGITHAFTLFAPRRMGKTQFILNDIAPKAEKAGFNVFYFSFMDKRHESSIAQYFEQSLLQFAQQVRSTEGVKTFFSSLSKVEVLGVGLERETKRSALLSLSEIIAYLAADNRPSLLLLDEVQELARQPNTAAMISSLRTGLDIHQRQIKTIFTGSSTNGLRAMFNDIKAPFFHFAHALDFPTLGQEFTDFLAAVYADRTGKALDKDELYAIFERLHKTPMYMRAMIQDMIINPSLAMQAAAQIRLDQMQESTDYGKQWQELSALERFIMQAIAKGQNTPYSAAFRQEAAQKLGVDEVKVSTIQSSLRKLTRKELITQNSHNALQINSPLWQTWLNEHQD